LGAAELESGGVDVWEGLTFKLTSKC
jgi:hypothetical protein